MSEQLVDLHSIIVTFNPDKINVMELVACLASTVGHVWVIDNGSSDSFFDDDFINALDNVSFVKLDVNVGIAKAQNIGIKMALNSNAKYLIFFDHDSKVNNGLIHYLYDEFHRLSEGEKIAAVGPVFFDPRFSFIYPIIKLNRFGLRKRIVPTIASESFRASFIISSGSLTSASVINDVGLFRDEFFIDYVDTEWCLRAASKGYKLYVVPSAVMEHTIGDANIKFLMWKLPVHSAFRRYYRMRNMFYLFRLPYVPLLLKIREFITNNIHQLIIVLSANNKKAYLRSWAKSFVDGVKILLGQ